MIYIYNNIKYEFNSEKSYLVISSDKVSNIKIENIRTELEKHKVYIGKHTKIEILAHGGYRNEAQDHTIRIVPNLSEFTKHYFSKLQQLSQYPLFIELQSCYGNYAIQAIKNLKPGSVLITHVK